MIRKSFLIPFALFCLAAIPVLAQDNQVITLNDANPGVDAMITLPADTTGVASLELSSASVTVTDSAGNIVFQVADPRTHAVELRFAPNSGPYTLSVTRLPGVAEAQVIVRSLPELTDTMAGTLIADGPLGPTQERDFHLSAADAASSVPLVIPEGSIGVVTASFPGAPVSQQLLDESGTAFATVYASGIDGISIALDLGSYQMTLQSSDASGETTGSVHVMPTTQVNLGTALTAPTAETTTVSAPSCNATILVSSLNLRSGPGPGYSIFGYGFRDEIYPVGGTNSDGSWVLLGASNGSAWVSNQYVQLSGECADLSVYNIPYRAAPSPEVIIIPAPTPQFVPQQPSGSQNFSEDGEGHEGGEHEGGDD